MDILLNTTVEQRPLRIPAGTARIDAVSRRAERSQ